MRLQDTLRATRMFAFPLLVALAMMLAFVLPVNSALAQDGTNPCGDSYTIQDGDTLIAIADTCGTTVNALLAANPTIDPRALVVGSELVMPTADDQAVVAEAALAIAPTAGPAGTQVSVIANNLTPNAAISIGIGRPNSEYDIIAETVSDGFGTISEYVTVPDFIGEDEWVIVVTNPATGTELFSSATTPTIAIAPTQGPPGTTLQVLVNDFPPNTEVDLGTGLWRSEFGTQQRVTTNERGTVQAAVTIPQVATSDERWVVVALTADQTVSVRSALFHVSAEPSATVPTATPMATEPAAQPTATVDPVQPTLTPMTGDENAPVFEQTQMFLIAPNDQGLSGTQIACGDSLIAVDIQIEPTTAPLTAALETLIATDSQYYGQSGLYHAMFASDLAIESVAIENGNATIRLTGVLRETHPCDSLRMKAQIVQTALQYDTVNSVTVYLNGSLWF